MANYIENISNEDQLEIIPMDDEINQQLLQDFRGERNGFVQVGVNKTIFYKKYETMAQDIRNFKVRPDDTWVITVPRSGTTPTAELVWLVSNDGDIVKATKENLGTRFFHLEENVYYNKEVMEEQLSELSNSPELQEAVMNGMRRDTLEAIDNAPSPRFIKTHVPIELLPRDLLLCGAKVVYVARHPKDVAVSQYHMCKGFRYSGYQGDFPKFWDYFEKSLVLCSPYWSHVLSAWNLKHEPNLLFVFYEDLNKNLKTTIKKIAKFLNKNLTEGQLLKVEEHLQFENFAKNPSVNGDILFKVKVFSSDAENFIRKGKVGGWVDEFTPELSVRADKWIVDNLKNTDFKFPA